MISENRTTSNEADQKLADYVASLDKKGIEKHLIFKKTGGSSTHLQHLTLKE